MKQTVAHRMLTIAFYWITRNTAAQPDVRLGSLSIVSIVYYLLPRVILGSHLPASFPWSYILRQLYIFFIEF